MADEEERPAKRFKYAVQCLPNSYSSLITAYYRLDFTETVNITVGQDRKLFTVPKNLVDDSEWLSRETDQCNEDGDTVHLPGISPFMFKVYLHCKTTGKVDVMDNDDGKDENGAREYLRLTHLYALTLELDDPELRDQIADRFVELSVEVNACPDMTTIREAYYIKPEVWMLKELIVDLCIALGGIEITIAIEEDKVPIQFLRDMTQAALRIGESEDRKFITPAERMETDADHYH